MAIDPETKESAMHPRVTHLTAPASERSDGLSGISADEFSKLERAAVHEIANHLDIESVTVDGRDNDGVLVVSFQVKPTHGGMPHTTLYVFKSGRIAEALPDLVMHRSFRELVEDVRFAANRGNGRI